MSLTCSRCKKPITGAKAVIDGQYVCPRCTYINDYPDKEVVEAKRPRAKTLQKETLFEPPPKIQKERRVPDMD